MYTDSPGERTIELIDSNGNVILDQVVDIPAYPSNGFIIDLDWDIAPGSNYLLTTNTQMNNENFGDNNPMLKRTTGGLPDFPFVINNILEITEGYYDNGEGNMGSSTDYYYYFYDWDVSFDRTCESNPLLIEIIVNNNVSLLEENDNLSIIKFIDVLGRETSSQSLIIEILNNGTVTKKVTLK